MKIILNLRYTVHKRQAVYTIKKKINSFKILTDFYLTNVLVLEKEAPTPSDMLNLAAE